MQPMTRTRTSRRFFCEQKRLIRLNARVSAVILTEQVLMMTRSAVSASGLAAQPRESRSSATEADSA